MDTNNLSRNGILIAIGVVVAVGVLGASIAHENAVQILGFCTLICASLFAQLTSIGNAKTQNDKLDVVAEKAENVKVALIEKDKKNDQKLDDIAAVGTMTHTLVNSNMGTQLKISAVALNRIAELTGHAGDIAAASLADKLLKEHESKQAAVDLAHPPALPVQATPVQVTIVPAENPLPVNVVPPA